MALLPGELSDKEAARQILYLGAAPASAACLATLRAPSPWWRPALAGTGHWLAPRALYSATRSSTELCLPRVLPTYSKVSNVCRICKRIKPLDRPDHSRTRQSPRPEWECRRRRHQGRTTGAASRLPPMAGQLHLPRLAECCVQAWLRPATASGTQGRRRGNHAGTARR